VFIYLYNKPDGADADLASALVLSLAIFAPDVTLSPSAT
jgi:hypothetical protein